MKKFMRKLMTVCLTLVLVATLIPMGAMALTENATGEIVVTGLNEDVDITVYKLMDVHYDDVASQPKDPMFTWVSAVASWMEANYPAYIEASTDAVTKEFSQLSSDTAGYGTAIATFYDKLANAINAGDVTVAAAATATGNGNIGNLTMGNYLLLIENGLKVYRPSTVNLIPVWDAATEAWTMSTANVVIKSSEPSINKTQAIVGAADGANDAKVGDTITYTVVTDVPVYPDNASAKGYQIGDDLPAGVTLDTASIKAYGIGTGATATELTSGYTLTTTAGTTANNTAVDFLVDFDYEQIRNYSSVKVEYSVTVNEGVVLGTNGNTNTAYLVYNNNPYDNTTWNMKSSGTSFYSFGIDVTKLGEDGKALTGAEFELSSADATAAYTFKQNADGSYSYATGAGSSTVLAVDADGKLNLHGLVPGTYYLTETKAPAGYVKLQSAVVITITESNATQGAVAVNENGTASDDASGIVKINVTNVMGFALPITGGTGTLLFTIAGIVMVGVGVLIILGVSRKSKRTH